ncbi:kinase-like domain-containing protein [Xylogone sp. PMI_703]|nr:kinase-like domain-containing protein [Xylogone sp. PMI_703]
MQSSFPTRIFCSFGSDQSRFHHSLARTISTDSARSYEHFFRYTSGRWLWDEEERLRERYRSFNVQELQRIAASIGAQSCLSMIKLAEGGYNKVFRLAMDNGAVAIARIPNPNARSDHMMTASEVATMEFSRTVLKIPTPKVYAWSASTDNHVEAEYIIMEEASGVQLKEVWHKMDIDDKTSIVENLVEIEKKLLSVSFTQYGNIYFTDDTFPGCESAKLLGNVSVKLKREVEERFVIGPVVDAEFWVGKRASMAVDRGPWKLPQEYLASIANREIAWIKDFASPKSPKDIFFTSEAQNTPGVHISLYKMFLDIVSYIFPKSEQLSRSTLWHWDIHSANLFVKGTQITSLIDWQETWAGPLFLQFRHPKLVNYNGEVLLKLPEHYESLEESDEKASIRKQVEKSIVEVLRLPYGQTRRDAVKFATNTLDGDILPFRECLIRIERHWKDLGIDAPCPIHFSKDELEAHYRDAEGWNEQADF